MLFQGPQRGPFCLPSVQPISPPSAPVTAPQPPAQEPLTYSATEFRVGYDISDTQPLAYIKDIRGESPLPIDRIEEHPGPRELIVEGDWVTLRLPQEKE